MTIQVAVMNGYGVALASDRHVFRGGDTRSTGQDVKLHRLRGPVPAAMMASGPFAVFGVPVSRLVLRLERALAASAGAGPEAMCESLLHALEKPIEGPVVGADADADLLAEVAGQVVGPALDEGGDARAALQRLVAEMANAPGCRDAESVEASVRTAWEASLPRLVQRVSTPALAQALREAPELCGRAVAGALARDWRADLFITVGLCCPETGVPAMLALRLWKGIGRRLHFVSRLQSDYEVAWRAGRTVVVAQGSGRMVVESLVDGLGDEHWESLSEAGRDVLRPGMDGRWDRAHGRLGVSSPRELSAVATGLVRGAEVVGYLTRQSESTMAEIDCLCLTPRGTLEGTLPAGPVLTPPA